MKKKILLQKYFWEYEIIQIPVGFVWNQLLIIKFWQLLFKCLARFYNLKQTIQNISYWTE